MLDFNIAANWDFSGLNLDLGDFDITDFASSLNFNLEDDVLNASLSGKSATPYYSDYEYSNASLQEQEWFKPEYKNILNSFFEGQDQSIGAAFTADNARMALWHDAQKALSSGADPDKVFNALRAAGNKSEAKLIEENITNKRKLAGKKGGSTGQFESLVVNSARENLNTFNSNLSSTLQSNPNSFNSQFDALPTNGKLSFLHHQYKQGDLPKDKYEEAYIATVNSAYDPNARNTPVFVEVEGKVYLNPSPWQTNKTADELLEPDFYNVDEWSPAGGSENAIGVRVTGERTDDFDPSGFKKFLQDFSVFRAPLALVTAGASEAFISAAAGLSGETLKTSDWLNLASFGLNQIANTTGTTAAEAEATARATVDEAITNGTVTTAAEAQALYESTLASIDVAGTLLGVDLTDFATDTGALSSGGSAIADAVSALEAAAEGEGAGVVLNLLEDTVDSLEDVDEDTTSELEIINEIINTIITDDEDEEVIATPPPQVETEQELPDAPEAVQEPIVADPIDEVIPQPTLPEVVEEVVEAGGGGEPAPEPTAPTEPTEPTAPTEPVEADISDVEGIAPEEDPDIDLDVPGRYEDNPEFDPDSMDNTVLKQVYDAILKETDADVLGGLLEEYERMGGNHLDEVLSGVPTEEVYADYPTETIFVEGDFGAYESEDEFNDQFPDGWLDGSFDDVDADNDGTVSSQEIYDWEHRTPNTEEEDFGFIDIIGDITEDTVDPVIDPIDTIADPIDTTQPSPVGTTQPSPVDTVTDSVTDVVTDVISDVIGGGNGTGTGTGTGDGTGDGSGTGDGTGAGTGAGTGLGFGSATRTTDSLFGDMLQLETQIGSTQERLRPFSMAPVPTTMQYDVPPVDPIQQFLQQQEAQRLRNKPQGMLTNAEILKRFPY